jgi:hypothetical protein
MPSATIKYPPHSHPSLSTFSCPASVLVVVQGRERNVEVASAWYIDGASTDRIADPQTAVATRRC